MKPPAFQFYPDDFLGGTVTMSHEERGLYILLLCVQWSKGGLTEDDFSRLGRTVVEPSLNHVRTKFKLCSNGFWKNTRLEEERDKQTAYREAQAEKGRLSAKARLNRGSTAVKPNGEPEVNSPSPIPIAERECAERPSLEEVIGYASMIGLAAWKAEDFFNEMEGCGWLDHQHRPIQKWQNILSRVRTKWEADGRPKTPPVRIDYQKNGASGKPGEKSLVEKEFARAMRPYEE